MGGMIVPREHGAWGMLLAPFGAAVVTAGVVNAAVCAAVVALLAAFWIREPAVVLARQWFVWRERKPETRAALRTALVSALALAVSTGFLLRAVPPVPLLVLGLAAALLGVVSVAAAVMKRQRSLALQAAAAVALSSSSLVGSLAATGAIREWAWWLWFLMSAHAVTGVAVVRARLDAMAARAKGRDERAGRRRLAGMLAAMVGVAAVVLAVSGRPWLGGAAALSALLHGLELKALGTERALRVPLRRVGLRALGASIAYAATAAIVLRRC